MPRHLSSKNFPLYYEKLARIKNLSFPTLFVTVLAITIPHTRYCTQDSQIGTATTLRNERRWNLNSVLSRCLDLSHLHSGQNGSVGHPASYAASTRFLSPELTLRSLTLYIYGAPILDVSRSHTTTQHCR